MNPVIACVSLAVLAILVSLPVTAHEGARGIVKQRMNQMSMMESSLKKIAGIIRSGGNYDRKEIITLARNIAKHSGENMTRLFPESSKTMRSEAEATIWEEWDIFQSEASDLLRKAETLTKLASAQAEQAEMMTATRQLAASCSSCHRQFRRPE